MFPLPPCSNGPEIKSTTGTTTNLWKSLTLTQVHIPTIYILRSADINVSYVLNLWSWIYFLCKFWGCTYVSWKNSNCFIIIKYLVEIKSFITVTIKCNNLMFFCHPYHLHPTLDNKLNKSGGNILWNFSSYWHYFNNATYLFSIPKELSEKSIEEKTVCSYESHRISEMPPFLLMWGTTNKKGGMSQNVSFCYAIWLA